MRENYQHAGVTIGLLEHYHWQNCYVDKKLGEIWGYVTDGFIQDKAEAEQQAVRQKVIATTWLPGDIRYADLDGNGAVDYGKNTLSDHGDKKIIGNNTPRYRFNISGLLVG